MTIPFSLITEAAGRNDLECVGALPIGDADAVLRQHSDYLHSWQSQGYAAEMGYMQRAPELFRTLKNVLPDARSIVCFAVPYSREFLGDSLELPDGCGRVARYAWGKDYHRVLVRRLRRFVQDISNSEMGVTDIKARVFADAVPILERALVQAAGLGFVGKNSLLITRKKGSFQFLCEVVWNVDVEIDDSSAGKSAASPKEFGCGTCTKCLVRCPTHALTAPAQLDSGRCISYLTIEKKGLLDDWQRRAVGEWLFGCDDCQDVCPFNHSGIERGSVEEFSSSEGPGPFVDVAEVLGLRSHEQFSGRFAGTALMRAGREGLLRNACAVAANRRIYGCIDRLYECAGADVSELVRAQAAGALNDLMADADGSDKRKLAGFLDNLARMD